MTKVLCSYSGITFNVEHFPITLTSRESHHPIFDVNQKRLLSYLGKWAGGELTPTDSYLLFLALLNSSDHVDFRVAVYRHDLTNAIVATNMEALASTVIKLNSVTNPHVVFPSIVISPETKGLLNVHHWIEAWKEAYYEFINGYVDYSQSQKLVRREAALEKLIKNPFKEPSSYAKSLAEWANDAGSFPRGTQDIGGKQIALADYWKDIIIRCSTDVGLFSVPLTDIKDLLEHCEQEIPIGSIFSQRLFSTLRRAIERQQSFLGIDKGRTTFEILDNNDSIEAANVSAILQTAPEVEPKLESYPNKLSFLKAQLAWRLTQRKHQ